jgi:capsular exopolysaccharide synthesis family protein
MVAFAQETLDSSIKTAEEVESLTISPALAVIPFERLSWFSRRRLGKNSGSDHLTLALSKRPKSPLSEAFRVLGTAISIPSHPPKTLLITSACAGEGKTMTALNLAQALAQRKGPVVIVDCDLRKDGLSQLLGCKNDRGITPVLTGEQDLSEAIQQCSSQRNLWILPSGPIPPNPAELLASDRMSTVLQTLAARFECVVIDSPPVLAVTDAAVLSSRVDGVVLVVASGSTPRGGLVRARKILASVGARVIGVTMNKFESRRQDRGYYSYTG